MGFCYLSNHKLFKSMKLSLLLKRLFKEILFLKIFIWESLPKWLKFPMLIRLVKIKLLNWFLLFHFSSRYSLCITSKLLRNFPNPINSRFSPKSKKEFKKRSFFCSIVPIGGLPNLKNSESGRRKLDNCLLRFLDFYHPKIESQSWKLTRHYLCRLAAIWYTRREVKVW